MFEWILHATIRAGRPADAMCGYRSFSACIIALLPFTYALASAIYYVYLYAMQRLQTTGSSSFPVLYQELILSIWNCQTAQAPWLASKPDDIRPWKHKKKCIRFFFPPSSTSSRLSKIEPTGTCITIRYFFYFLILNALLMMHDYEMHYDMTFGMHAAHRHWFVATCACSVRFTVQMRGPSVFPSVSFREALPPPPHSTTHTFSALMK